MKIAALHSHLNGHEWLLVHEKKTLQELLDTIQSIDAKKCKTKVSAEKTMKGKLCYSPIELNALFTRRLQKTGWKDTRTSYWVTDDYQLIRKTMFLAPKEQKRLIEEAGKRAIFSYNQTDFVKNRVAIEVQMGKYSFISYDLFVKHLAFYIGDKIDVGVEVLPMKAMQEEMSSGPGYYEGALYDIARQGRGVPPVPLVLIGIEP